MGAHIVLNLLVNELGETIRCEWKILFIIYDTKIAFKVTVHFQNYSQII